MKPDTNDDLFLFALFFPFVPPPLAPYPPFAFASAAILACTSIRNNTMSRTCTSPKIPSSILCISTNSSFVSGQNIVAAALPAPSTPVAVVVSSRIVLLLVIKVASDVDRCIPGERDGLLRSLPEAVLVGLMMPLNRCRLPVSNWEGEKSDAVVSSIENGVPYGSIVSLLAGSVDGEDGGDMGRRDRRLIMEDVRCMPRDRGERKSKSDAEWTREGRGRGCFWVVLVALEVGRM
mmetsp:Transcript_2389/g.4345  ORF Transcript_2389/g.4345 Transcript_2389/m.4345 type:complete len:234 (-) Transcript_2389:1596-2297(-)